VLHCPHYSSEQIENNSREFLGTFRMTHAYPGIACMEEETMDGLIYLIGLIVVIMAILSFFGLR
jgi:hypothetical protein